MPGKLVLGVLRHIWVSLEPLGAPMAVMGGVAVSSWGYNRSTHDVDLLINVESSTVDAVLATLGKAGIRPKHQPPVLDLGTARIMQLLFEPAGTFVEIQVDLLFAESPYQREALARRQPTRLEKLDIEIFVLSCEDLILHKLIANRLIDRADAAMLLRINRATLDLAYFKNWIAQLELTQKWAEIWPEAFPGEPSPI